MKEHQRSGHVDGTSDRLLMQQAASLLATDLSLGELFERLTTMLPAYLDSSVVFIALARDDGRHAIEYIYDHGEIRPYPHIRLTERSRARAVIESGEIIWGSHPSEWAPQGAAPINPDRPWTNDTLSAMFVPMRVGGKVLGCLSVQSVHEAAYRWEDVETIAAIGHYVGVAVQNQRMYQAMQRTADYDALTSLTNHSRIVREIDAALRSLDPEQPVATIMLDIVNFARFNETHGHGAGDEVLRSVASVLRSFEAGEESTLAARFGGDVFMVLMRGHALDDVASAVGRLSDQLAQVAYIAGDQTLPVPVACGFAVAPSEARTRSDLLALTEERARRSRASGVAAVGPQGGDAYRIYGDYSGLETIVDSVLDHDPFTRVHLLHVNALANAWAGPLGLDGAVRETFVRASLLHDVGKLLVPERLLSKPGRLTPQEFDAVMRHAEYGRHILAAHEGCEEIAQIVGEHHERFDGFGYPQGLRGEAIHPIARAISILDAFSAMVADRPYHRAITATAALAELQRCSGGQFDPRLVETFVSWYEEGNPPPVH